MNSPDAVMLLNPGADAGLVMKLVPPAAGKTHGEIIRSLVQTEQGQAQRYALSGLPATHFAGTRTNEQGQVQGIEGTLVTGPRDQHYLLAYVAKNAQGLANARGGLRAAEASFRPMTDADRAAARPWVLHIVPAPAGGFEQLARNSPITDNAEQQLRLLNGYYGGGAPPTGSPVKTVR